MGLMNRKQIAPELLQLRRMLLEKKLLTPDNNQALILVSEILTTQRPEAPKMGKIRA